VFWKPGVAETSFARRSCAEAAPTRPDIWTASDLIKLSARNTLREGGAVHIWVQARIGGAAPNADGTVCRPSVFDFHHSRAAPILGGPNAKWGIVLSTTAGRNFNLLPLICSFSDAVFHAETAPWPLAQKNRKVGQHGRPFPPHETPYIE